MSTPQLSTMAVIARDPPSLSTIHSAITRADPVSAISFPKIAPSMNSGKYWIR